MVNLVERLGWSFAVFSPENWPAERHLQTLIEKFERKPFAKDGYNERRMDRQSVIEVLGAINNHFQFIVPEEGLLTVEAILEKARVAVFRHGVKGLVIDPWNELDHVYANLTEAQYLSDKLTKIRRFARMNGIHIWVVAHPKNLVKDKAGVYQPPTMYEISGGAHWRNKADNGICVHRPDYTNDTTEIYIQKIRFREVGKTGSVKLKYIRDSGTYGQEAL
jgi:twinkle protein